MSNLISIFNIEYPAIKSAGVYYFETTSGLRYEVRFGRRQHNILHATIVFGVVNEEFDGDEYATTNRGEVYMVMNTIVHIIKDFILHHDKVNVYEFNAIDRDDEREHSKSQQNKIKGNARLKLYKRYLPKIFNTKEWDFNFNLNNALVSKNK